MTSAEKSAALRALARTWTARARSRWVSARNERAPMGKLLIENGAMCYLNCAEELLKALRQKSSDQPPSSKTPRAAKTSTKGRA